MVTDGNSTYGGDHFIMNKNNEFFSFEKRGTEFNAGDNGFYW